MEDTKEIIPTAPTELVPQAPVTLIEWQAEEYEHYDKSPDWFWAVTLIAFTGIVLAVIFKNFLFAIILLISAFLIITYGARPPEVIKFAITTRGIKIKNELYRYEGIRAFWVHDDKKPPKLMIHSERLFLPYIILPLGSTDPHRVREHLLKYLPEEPHEESLIEAISEHLGF